MVAVYAILVIGARLGVTVPRPPQPLEAELARIRTPVRAAVWSALEATYTLVAYAQAEEGEPTPEPLDGLPWVRADDAVAAAHRQPR